MMQHQQLAAGRWRKLSLIEQMAHVGSEVNRALKWRHRHPEYSRQALWRALELLWLTIDDPKNRSRLKEITRTYEFLVDFFLGKNQYSFSADFWQKYFLSFAIAARNRTKSR
ncbi:hypothetical protein J7J95_01590 [bacterium]|nr:hypothetical protein [bacterium]